MSLTASADVQTGATMTKAYEAVDLGLPSGLLWAKMNIGATSETDYGLYFAWGSTVGHTATDGYDFSWENAPYYTGDGNTHSWSKYTKSTQVSLEPDDDAAHVNWGGNWRMPTEADFQELLNNTNMQWVLNFNNTGVSGYKFTNKKNATKYIFLPAGGFRNLTSQDCAGWMGRYWTASLSMSYGNEACSLYFSYNGKVFVETSYRHLSFNVRAVKPKN